MPPGRFPRIRPQDVLNEREFKLYERARREELSCHRRGLPLLTLPDRTQTMVQAGKADTRSKTLGLATFLPLWYARCHTR